MGDSSFSVSDLLQYVDGRFEEIRDELKYMAQVVSNSEANHMALLEEIRSIRAQVNSLLRDHHAPPHP